MKLIDTFCFNGESIVRFRLKYLDPFVEEFYIIEAWETHSGVKKDELYSIRHKDWFQDYEGKIKWIIIEKFPEPSLQWYEENKNNFWMLDNKDHWFREEFQRNISISYIDEKYNNMNYCVIVCDVDEIPNKDYLHSNILESILNNNDEPIYFEMEFLYYNFNWIKPYKWYKAYLISGKRIKDKQLSSWRTNYNPKYMLKQGGWHLSYFMNTTNLLRKLRSFAHRECDRPHYDENYIENCIISGRDLFERGQEEDCIRKCRNDFPKDFLECIELFDNQMS